FPSDLREIRIGGTGRRGQPQRLGMADKNQLHVFAVPHRCRPGSSRGATRLLVERGAALGAGRWLAVGRLPTGRAVGRLTRVRGLAVRLCAVGLIAGGRAVRRLTVRRLSGLTRLTVGRAAVGLIAGGLTVRLSLTPVRRLPARLAVGRMWRTTVRSLRRAV